MIAIATEPRTSAPARTRVRRGIAMIVSRFPKVTETFILREIDELERQGQPVLLVPLIREKTCVLHDEARPWTRRALFTPHLSLQIVASNLRQLRRQPLRYTRLLALLIARTLRDPTMLFRIVALWPKAVHLAERIKLAGVRHIHAHFATHPTTVALIIHELTGIGFSFTAHAHDIFVSRAALREKIARADFVRAISAFNRNYLLERYPAECAGKVQVIHMGIDVPAYVQRARERSAPSILCVAALRPYKGIEVLIDACAELRDSGVDLQCVIIGEGPLRAALEQRIAERGLAHRILLVGALPQDRVREHLSRASMFVLPSVVARDGQMEGIPVALMEAMAAWLPVVASRLSGIPELVIDEETGLLVEPGDAAGIARAVRRLLEEPWLARQLAARGARLVQWQFSLVNTAATLLNELDRHNPLPGDDVQQLIGASTWQGFERGAVGVARVHERRDSRVLEIVAEGAPSPQRVVLKCQRTREGESYPAPARAELEFRLLSKLCVERTRAWPLCRVPRPIHLDFTNSAVLMEECRGVSLDELIRYGRGAGDPRRRAALLEGIRGAGIWLREFQAKTAVDRAAGPALAELLSAIDRDLLSRAGDTLSDRDAETLRSKVHTLRWRLSVSDLRVVGHHGDFWPGNVFVGEDGVEVIDFEGFRHGLPAEDAGYFLTHLHQFLRNPAYRSIRRRVDEAFLEGYRDNFAGTDASAALELAQIAASLRLLTKLNATAGATSIPALARWTRLRTRMLRQRMLRSCA